MNKIYTGIGSRKVPRYLEPLIQAIGARLESEDWFLQTGDASGFDQAIFSGLSHDDNGYQYTSKDGLASNRDTYDELISCLPTDRTKEMIDSCTPYVRGLLLRNMLQVRNSQFVICWLPCGDYNSADSCGGSVYAVRAAKRTGIPVFNLAYLDNEIQFNHWLATDISFNQYFGLTLP